MKDLRQVLFVFSIAMWASIPTSSWASPELMKAIQIGNLEQVKTLVQAGADINFKYRQEGNMYNPFSTISRPLCFAVIYKKPEIVEWLLNADAYLREECSYSKRMGKTINQLLGMKHDERTQLPMFSPYEIALMKYEEGDDLPSVRAIIGHLLKDRARWCGEDPHTQYNESPNSSGFALALKRADVELVQIFLKHSTREEFSKRHSGPNGMLTILKQRFIDASLQVVQAGADTLGHEKLRNLFECLNLLYFFPKDQKVRKNLIDSGISREALNSSSLCTSQSTPASTSNLHHLLPMDILMLIISYEDDNSKNSEKSANFNERLDSLKKAKESQDLARAQQNQALHEESKLERNIAQLNSEIGELYRFQFIKKKQLEASLSKAENALAAAEVDLISKKGLSSSAWDNLYTEQNLFETFIGDLQKHLKD